jgi:hypothetical protein
MIRLGLILIHNKGANANEAQITKVLQGVTKVTDTHTEFDSEGNPVGTFDTYHYEITGLGFAHEARFYQVVPQGVTRPPNLDLLDSWKVFFGPDQPSHNRRFFNWALKRAVDQGADAVIYIDDHNELTIPRLKTALQTLAGPRVWVDAPFGFVVEKKVLLTIGQMVEDGVTLNQAISELRSRIRNGGLTDG